MTKDVIFNIEARQAIFSGIKKVANTVKVTLGPKGRYVGIDGGSHEITNDGVTIAKSLSFSDPKENFGAKLIKEVASKTQDLAGDGTTTATVLADAIAQEGLKLVNSGANPIEIKKGIELSSKDVTAYLQQNTSPVNDKKQIAHVATISANNDQEIGHLIADAMDKVGNDGVITVEEASSLDTSIEVVDGMEFDKGFTSPYMVTNQEKNEVNFEKPYILITDHTISNLKDILPILQETTEMSKPLFIVCEDIEGEALTGIIINLLRGSLKLAAVKAPHFGNEKKAFLKDLAALTGGTAILKDEQMDLKDVTMTHLGTSGKIKATREKTTIINAEKHDTLNERINLLKEQIKEATNANEQSLLQKRLAALTGGIAVLKIGAATETEMKEKKARVDDALNATKAAVEEGIIVGGGVALLRAAQTIDVSKYAGDQKLGAQILKKALEYPFRLIVENGGKESSVILHKVLSESNYGYGYNAKTDTFENLIQSGVIDPLKVTRLALQNAVSVSSLLLITEALVFNEQAQKENDDKLGSMPGLGGLPM